MVTSSEYVVAVYNLMIKQGQEYLRHSTTKNIVTNVEMQDTMERELANLKKI